MKTNIAKLLNEQIAHEFHSANLYLSMSAYFDARGLKGFSNWMRKQFEEEQEHGLKIYEYLLERGEKVIIGQIDKPECDFTSTLDVMKMSLEHEKKITELIDNIMRHAVEEKDFATINLMNWFVDEQVEEESNVEFIIQQLEMAGDNGSALFMIDRELGHREEVLQ